MPWLGEIPLPPHRRLAQLHSCELAGTDPIHNVVKRAEIFDSQLSWHEAISGESDT